MGHRSRSEFAGLPVKAGNLKQHRAALPRKLLTQSTEFEESVFCNSL
jgi:hypothetical protein